MTSRALCSLVALLALTVTVWAQDAPTPGNNAGANVDFSYYNNQKTEYNGDNINIDSPNYPYRGKVDPAHVNPPAGKESNLSGDKRLPDHLRKQGWWIYDRSEYNVGVTIDYINNLKNDSLSANIKSTGIKAVDKATGSEKIRFIDYYPSMEVPQTAKGRVTNEDKMVMLDEAACKAVADAYMAGDQAKHYLTLYRIPDLGENKAWGIGGVGGGDFTFGDGLNAARRIGSLIGGTGYGKGGARFFPGSEIMIMAFADDPDKYLKKEGKETSPPKAEILTDQRDKIIPDVQKMVAEQSPYSPVFHFRWDESILWDEITNVPMARGQYAKLDRTADTFASSRYRFFSQDGKWTGARVHIVGNASYEGSRQHNMPLGDRRAANTIYIELGKRMVARGWTPEEFMTAFLPLSSGENLVFHVEPEFNRLVFFVFENFNSFGVINDLGASKEKKP